MILLVGTKDMAQMSFIEDDDMVETLPSDRTDQSFRVPVLPGRSERRRAVANAHRADTSLEYLAVDAVVIADQILRRRLPTEGLGQLPRHPFSCWMRRHVQAKDFASVVP